MKNYSAIPFRGALMLRGRSLTILLAVVLVFAIVGGFPAFTNAQRPSKPESAAGKPPKPSGSADLAAQLAGPFLIKRDLAHEQDHFYRSSTRYYQLSDAQGKVLGGTLVSGSFRRHLAAVREDGCLVDEFVWKNVTMSMIPPGGAPVNPRRLDFAENFTYRVCFEDKFHHIIGNIDQSKLPHTLEGFLFYEQIIDSYDPWDEAITHNNGHIEAIRKIGDEQVLQKTDGNVEIDFRPFGYWLFHMEGRPQRKTRMTGLTLINGQPAATLEFTGSELPTPFDSNMEVGGKMVARKSTTQIWSRAVVSLETGLPLWATLLERVDEVGHCQNPSSGSSGTYREIVLQEIDKQEFERSVAGSLK